MIANNFVIDDPKMVAAAPTVKSLQSQIIICAEIKKNENKIIVYYRC